MLRWVVMYVLCMFTSLYGVEWTQTYVFSGNSLRDGLCSRYHTPHFRQLIFSWNAARPRYGSYTFRGRVRNAHTRMWSSWHDMMVWGADVQRSFHRSQDARVEHMYVRLETMFPADAFEIYVHPTHDANLHDIRSVCVSISYYDRMDAEEASTYTAYPSITPLPVPRISQNTVSHKSPDRICSPTSLTMLLRYVTGQSIDVTELAEASFDYGLSAYGSWPFNIAAGCQYLPSHMGLYVHRLPRFYYLYRYLQSGVPVVISVRGGISGAPKDYPHGHLIVVVGVDTLNMKLICADPAMPRDEDVLVYYPLHDVLKAWENSHRLAYTVEV